MEEPINVEQLCTRLVLDYVHFNDTQSYEELARLFAEDGVFIRPNGESINGRDAILHSYRSRPAGRLTRHFCTNIRITPKSTDRASGLTYAVVYSANSNDPQVQHFGRKADPRTLIGEFEDEFVRTAEGWRFASRRARFVMHTG
jgi:hypothetical protein